MNIFDNLTYCLGYYNPLSKDFSLSPYTKKGCIYKCQNLHFNVDFERQNWENFHGNFTFKAFARRLRRGNNQKKYFFGKLFFKAEIQIHELSSKKPRYYLLDYETAKVNSGNGLAFIEENL